MRTLTEEFHSCDVLVIGAGTGGMMAAIGAAESGARVMLCEKGHARRSGGITGGNDHFQCYIPGIHSPELKEAFLRQNLQGLTDEDLERTYIDLSYEVLGMWESYGIKMKTDGHYEFTGHGWPGSTGKLGEPGRTTRNWIHFSDEDMSVKLWSRVKELGVQVMNRVMVTELIQNEDRVVTGAVGVSTREPKLLVFDAGSVVINTGQVTGYRLYPPPHLLGYSMAEQGTGDGEVMAYKAGADLQKGEFCSRQVSMRFGPWAGKGTWLGVVRDSNGDPIAPPYLEEPDHELGDPSISNSDAFDLAWAEGRAPVWLDARQITEEDEAYMKWGFESESLHALLDWFNKEEIPIRESRFEFTAMQPRTNLQARVSSCFETSVLGLYSVLRAHLSKSAVGGLVAGRQAAEFVRRNELETISDRSKISELKRRYEAILNRHGSGYADWREAQWAVLQVMHTYCSPHNRTEGTLHAGYHQLLRIREKTRRILKAGNMHDLYHCLEVLNIMDVAELVILAVNERKESRGIARRKDYPFTDPSLNKYLVITEKDGAPAFRWEPPRRGESAKMEGGRV